MNEKSDSTQPPASGGALGAEAMSSRKECQPSLIGLYVLYVFNIVNINKFYRLYVRFKDDFKQDDSLSRDAFHYSREFS